MSGSHDLAQFNVGLMRHPRRSREMVGYNTALEYVLPVATGWPGFLWIMDDDIIDLTEAYFGPHYASNISTWSDVDALKGFMDCPPHAAAMDMRSAWFRETDAPTFVLWWVPSGHHPGFEEATGRLENLRSNGPTEYAFTFEEAFPPPA